MITVTFSYEEDDPILWKPSQKLLAVLAQRYADAIDAEIVREYLSNRA